MVIPKKIAWGAVVVLVLFALGYAYTAYQANEASPGGRNSSFLNPVLESELNKHFIINFQPLRKKFDSISAKYPQKTYVYFAYLNNAAWAGVHERELFIAASLVKVPLAMAVYRAIEEGKIDSATEYTLEDLDINEQFGDEHGLSADQTVTVERLIEIMLIKSDNTAANALYTILNRVGVMDPLDEVYTAMGWEFRDGGVPEKYGLIHVKVLSNMFLSLYNATFISPEHSDAVLSHLASTDFDQEIDAGVPPSISVSHKIGIYEAEQVYSDCGIVYAPNREYILCVASSGAPIESARSFMKEISSAAYEYVISN